MSDVQTPTMPSTAPQPAWKRYLKTYTLVIFLVLIALKWIGIFSSSGELPGCSSDATKNGLSNVFKTANLELTRYVEIKTLSTTKEEITCNAVLAKTVGGTVDIDYRIFFEDKEPRVKVTRADDKP